MTSVYWVVAIWAVCLIAGAMLGSLRGNVAYGVLFPLLLGPLGLLLTYALLREPSGDAEARR